MIGQISSKEQRVPVQSPSSNVSGYSKSGAHTILLKDVPLFVDTGTAPIRRSKICSSRLGSGNGKCHRYDSLHTALCRRICICLHLFPRGLTLNRPPAAWRIFSPGCACVCLSARPAEPRGASL